jgi:Flp pilus assembly protein TadD
MDPLLRTAADHLQAGRLDGAESACRLVLARRPADARATHLLGLVERRRGRLEDAERLMRLSAELEPGNPEFRTNHAQLLATRGDPESALQQFGQAVRLDGRFRPARLGLARLANQLGRYVEAEAQARALVGADARDSEAWSALGVALDGLGRTLEARTALERAVGLAPGYAAARYNLAAVLCREERAIEALEQVESARSLGVAHPRLSLTRARALMLLDRYGEAEHELAALVSDRPEDLDAQFLLAQLRHVRGDEDFAAALRSAASRPGAPPAVGMMHADVLRRAGQTAAAERLVRELLARHGAVPQLLSSLGNILHESGRYAEAVAVARQAVAAMPDDVPIVENYVAALLSAGEPAEAIPVIERFRARTPLDQRWITYRIDAARQLREPLFEEWCDVQRLVRPYDLPPPPGYSSIEEFNAALRPVIESRHAQRHHPLDQSMRFGTQTSRGLLGDDEPLVVAFRRALEEPIAAYQAALGRDDRHPLLARNVAPARLVGCWSVRLRRGGHHVNHIHPEGWISSAYYLAVPAEVQDPVARIGWIKFGEPRFPMPGGEPLRLVQPRAGRLVLFPSYLWHGTTPIHGDEPRMTIAFDAVPRAA